MHEVEKLDIMVLFFFFFFGISIETKKYIDKKGTMVSSMNQDKAVSFASLILHIDFIILDKFIDVVEYKASLFLVIP